MDDVCGCAGVMSCLTSCHVMTKEDIMVCKMIGKIGEKWVVSLQYPPRRLLSPGEVFFIISS
jgi:hypothetical protein